MILAPMVSLYDHGPLRPLGILTSQLWDPGQSSLLGYACQKLPK